MRFSMSSDGIAIVEIFFFLGKTLFLPSIPLFSWMLFLDDLFEISGINLGVFRGGVDLTVAEDFPNVGDVGAALE